MNNDSFMLRLISCILLFVIFLVLSSIDDQLKNTNVILKQTRYNQTDSCLTAIKNLNINRIHYEDIEDTLYHSK